MSYLNNPVSLYAASKRSNELMAHSCSHLFDLPTTGLRFFTVGATGYGVLFFYSKNTGRRNYSTVQQWRDESGLDDVVCGISRIVAAPPSRSAGQLSPCTSSAPFRIYNIGNNQPVGLQDMVVGIEHATGREAIIELKRMQAGDVYKACADTEDLYHSIGYRPILHSCRESDSLLTGFKEYTECFKNQKSPKTYFFGLF